MGLSAALATARDGVVGSWMLPDEAPANHPRGAATLALWGPDVRYDVMLTELMEGVRFRADATEARLELATDQGKETLVVLTRPSEETFRTQTEYLRGYAALRLERLEEILWQLDDIVSFISAPIGLQPHRHLKTMELLNLVIGATVLIEMRLKHELACRRPVEYAPGVQPVIETPGHGAFPSGHATESFVIAWILAELQRQASPNMAERSRGAAETQMLRHAERIAINRTVAGVHFPIDSVCGMILGRTLFEFYTARMRAGAVEARRFNADHYRRDFDYQEVERELLSGESAATASRPLSLAIEPTEMLQWLWSGAVAEWRTSPAEAQR